MPSSTSVSAAAPPAQQRAFALVLHGMLGTILWSPSAALWRGNQGSPRLVKVCSASHVEHIVRANEADGVDVFLHSWNPELAAVLDSAYAPHLRGSLHEPPVYAEKTRSQALSIARAVRLVRRHERQAAFTYKLVFVMRYDLIVAAPVPLARFDPSRITFAEHCCAPAGEESPAWAWARLRQHPVAPLGGRVGAARSHTTRSAVLAARKPAVAPRASQAGWLSTPLLASPAV